MNTIVLDTETTNKNPHKATMLGWSSYLNDKTFWDTDPYKIKKILEDDSNFIICHNGKYDSIVCGGKINISFDTMIAYYLLHIDRPRKLEKIVEQLFGRRKDDLLSLYNKYSKDKRERKKLPDQWWLEIPEEALASYAQEDVREAYNIYLYCQQQFEKNPKLKQWFNEVEIPLANILAKAELAGVSLNVEQLKVYEKKWTVEKESLFNKLRWMVGEPELNINSPKQLQEVLYKKLRLPKYIKTATGWSTNSKVLQKLQQYSGFVRNLCKYRELEKLLNSFVVPLQEQADMSGFIHPTFNQALTKTRRFSCEDPNLQQIPRRSEHGKLVRECFIPRAGHKFLIADYSQIELRLLAHFSGDPNLVKAFVEDSETDFHTYTASLMFKVKPEEVTPAMRDIGKTLNFSILYGKTAYGFAQDWNCSQDEAQEKIDLWFKQFPRVHDYIEEQKAIGRNNRGWIKTLAGLPLYIENVLSNKSWEYEEAGRRIVNYRIQGSSQDVIKKAIVEIYNEYNVYPCLMVHDELVYDLPDKIIWMKTGVKNIINKMESVWKLNVPIKVEYTIADKWSK